MKKVILSMLSIFAIKAHAVNGKLLSVAEAMDLGIVSIVDSDQTTSCTGSLLDRRTVLTAAHCIESAAGVAFFRVRSAEPAGTEGDFRIFIKDRLVNPKYFERQNRVVIADVGLIFLESEVPANYSLAKIAGISFKEKLPILTQIIPAEKMSSRYDQALMNRVEILETGFGSRLYESSRFGMLRSNVRKWPSDMLRLAQDSVAAPAEELINLALASWNEFVASYNEVKSDIIVVPLGSTICHGDSGGPFYIKVKDQWIQIGIVQGGKVNDDDLCVGYNKKRFTSTLRNQEWIEQTLKEYRK